MKARPYLTKFMRQECQSAPTQERAQTRTIQTEIPEADQARSGNSLTILQARNLLSERIQAAKTTTPKQKKVEEKAITKKEEQRFYEEIVLDLEKSAQEKFQTYMESIITDLDPEHDWNAKPIEFVIDRKNKGNAFHLKLEDRTIVGITADMLENESLLYWVVGHEYGHFRAREYGVKNNSKAEEAFADLHLLTRIEELGLDTTVAERFFGTGKRQSLGDLITQAAIDVHPLNPTRQGLIESYLGYISAQRGGLNANNGSIRQRSTVNIQIQDLIAHQVEIYNQKPKRSVLNEFIQNQSNDNGSKLTIRGLLQELSDIQITHNKREELEKELIQLLSLAQNEAFDEKGDLDTRSKRETQFDKITKEISLTVESIINNYDSIYDDSQKPTNNFLSLVALAGEHGANFDIGGLKEQLKNFTEAKTTEDIKNIAQQIMETMETHQKIFGDLKEQLTVVNNYDAVGFRLPRPRELSLNEDIDLPWGNHIAALSQDTDHHIKSCLLLLGVIDEDLYQATDLETLLTKAEEPLAYANLTNANLADKASRITSSEKIATFTKAANGKTELKYFSNLSHDEHYESVINFEINDRNPDELTKGIEKAYQAILDASNETERNKAQKRLKQLRLKQEAFLYVFENQPNQNQSKTSFRDDESQYYKKLPLIGLDKITEDPELFVKTINAKQLDYAIHQLALIDKLNELSEDPSNYKTIKEVIHHLNSEILHTSFSSPIKINISEFILASDAFSAKEKAEAIGKLGFYKDDNTAIDELEQFNHAYRLDEVESFDELEARLDYINSLRTESREANQFLDVWAAAQATDIIEVFGADEEIPTASIVSKLSLNAIISSDQLKAVLAEEITNINYTELELNSRIDFYCKLSTAQLIDSHTKELEIINSCSTQIQALDDLQTKLSSIEALMTSNAYNFPKIKKELNQLWIQTSIEIAENNDDRIYDMTASISKRISQRDAHELVVKLADTYQSQADLSKRLGDLVKKGAIEAATGASTLNIGMMETIKSIANYNAPVRDALMNLLFENTKKNKKALESSLELYIRSNLITPGLDVQKKNEFKTWLTRNEAERDNQYDLFHQNFWDQPLYAKAGIIKDITLPYKSNNAERDQTFWGATSYVLDKLFSGDTPYAAESRKTLIQFCKVLKPRERSLFISSIFAAAEQNRGNDKENIGERLATLFSSLGPAWVKLGQAIHSYDKTPEEIRSGMKMMKLDVDAPNRWDLFEQMKANLPEALTDRIVNVGKRLGSASYYFVYEVELDDGKKYALAMLKPNARKRSEYGFQQMKELILEMEASGEDSDYLSALKELVEQSHDMAAVETDNDNVEKQAEAAETLCGHKTIKVNNREVHIDIARNIETGEGYRLMELAKGEMFNEIDVSSNPEWYKEFGLAYHSLELSNILSGGLFDEDSHGGQMKVIDNKGTRFDFGAIKLEKASDEELYKMGLVFNQFYKGLISGQQSDDIAKELSTKFIAAINEHRASGDPNTGYLTSVHKAWLALADFRRDFSQDDYKSMFVAVFKSGNIDEKIMEGFYSSMGTIEKASFKASIQLMQPKTIIQIPKQRA